MKNTNQDFYIASLFSLLNDINPFINEKNHWTGTYIPAYFRIFPFLLGYSKDKKDPYLCFSTSSNFIHQKLENNLYPFFDKNENLSKELERIFKLLLVVEKERAFLKKSIKSLSENKLLKKWDVDIKFKEGNKKIEGLYKIDPEKPFPSKI